MEFNMATNFDDEKGVWRVKVQGEIDIYNSKDFKADLAALLEEKNADVYIDCEKLEYIDSTGLGALVGILKILKRAENSLHLYNLKSSILKLFKITDLDKVFVIDEVN